MAGWYDVPKVKEVLLNFIGEDVDVQVLVTALNAGILKEHDEVINVLHVLLSVLRYLGIKRINLLGLNIHLLDNLANGVLRESEDISVYNESLVLKCLWLLEDSKEVSNSSWDSIVVRLLGEGEVLRSLLLSSLSLEEVIFEIVLGKERISRVGLSLGVKRSALSASSWGALGDWGDLSTRLEELAIKEVVRDDQA